MPDSLEELKKSAQGLGDVAGSLGNAARLLGEHSKKFVDLLADFELVDAAEEAPELVRDEVREAAQTTGEAAQAVGHAAEAVPAATEDVLDAGQEAVAPVKKRFRLRKRR